MSQNLCIQVPQQRSRYPHLEHPRTHGRIDLKEIIQADWNTCSQPGTKEYHHDFKFKFEQKEFQQPLSISAWILSIFFPSTSISCGRMLKGLVVPEIVGNVILVSILTVLMKYQLQRCADYKLYSGFMSNILKIEAITWNSWPSGAYDSGCRCFTTTASRASCWLHGGQKRIITLIETKYLPHPDKRLVVIYVGF